MRRVLRAIGFLLLLVSTNTLAAGDQIGSVPPPSFANEPAFYIEGYFGYAFRDWPATLGSPYNGGISTATSNGTGGLIGGGAAGYAFKKCLAAELGWFHLPTVSGAVAAGTNTLSSWSLYGAAKLMCQIMKIKSKPVYTFMKFGISFNYTRPDGSWPAVITPGTSLNGFSIFAASGVYAFVMKNVYVGFEYAFIPGEDFFTFTSEVEENNQFAFKKPNANLLLLIVGFQMST